MSCFIIKICTCMGTQLCLWTKLYFLKVNPFNLEFLIQDKNLPIVIPSSQIKIWGKSVKGFMSYDRTKKQTDKQGFIYTDTSFSQRMRCYWRHLEKGSFAQRQHKKSNFPTFHHFNLKFFINFHKSRFFPIICLIYKRFLRI